MARLNKKNDNYDPGVLSVIMDPETNEFLYVSINNNIVKLDDNKWSWDALELPSFALHSIHSADADTKYKVFVAHIVKAYYDDNDEMSIFANFLKDPNNTKYKQELDDLQSIRDKAKILAKHIISNNLF